MSPARRWNSFSPLPTSLLGDYRGAAASDEALLDHGKKVAERRNRRFLTIVGLSIFILSAVGLLLSHSESLAIQRSTAVSNSNDPTSLSDDVEQNHQQNPYASSHVLNGGPTMRFRDNLRPDKRYITSWISAGWTNDVITYMNLIYMGLITDRIPIVAMFTPTHIGGEVPPIPFSEVFDIPRLRQLLNRPVLEWQEVKNDSSAEIDDLGCWSVWESTQYREDHPRRSVVPDLLSLDISYTKTPSWIKFLPNYEHDPHTTFWSLAVLAFPEGHKENLVTPRESQRHHVLLPPDEHLLCYDYLYYVCAQKPFEFEYDYSPTWRFVGQYMHWTPKLDGLVDQYVRRTFAVPDGEITPKWITVHARRGDFKGWCGDVAASDCFPPLSVLAQRVREVKEELLAKKGIVVENVIMTSDEKDEAWWEGVRSYGWLQVNHALTMELYGPWYPVLIDAGIQSGGVGFVGTDRSTMSIMARRRVQSWHDGVVRTVKWGRPGADDH